MGWVLNVRKDDLWPPDFFNLVNVFFFQHTLPRTLVVMWPSVTADLIRFKVVERKGATSKRKKDRAPRDSTVAGD